MGMTISEAISKLRYELNKNNKMANAYVMAIDIMRKYQKINEIVKNTDRNADTVRNALAFGDIAKVVEDGNNDQHN